MKRKFLTLAAVSMLALGAVAPASAFENGSTNHAEVVDPTLPNDQKNYVTTKDADAIAAFHAERMPEGGGEGKDGAGSDAGGK